MLSHPAAVVFTGDTYLVVWQESSPNVATTKIMARRLRLDGTPLDDQPMLLADPGAEPSLAFNGSTVLLAYVVGEFSFGFGSFGGGAPSFVDGIRFDRSGNRVDATPFLISSRGSGRGRGTAVASRGPDLLGACRHGPPIYCA